MRYQDWIEKEARDWDFDKKMENWDRMVPADPPKCQSCGVPLRDHLGLEGTCAELIALRQLVLDWYQDKEWAGFHLQNYAKAYHKKDQ